MNNKKQLIIISIVFIVIVILVLSVYLLKNTESETNTIIELDEKRVEIETEQFLSAYLNFDTESLRNGTWLEEVSKFVDYDTLKNENGTELYNRIYEKDWQLSHLVNENTVNKLLTTNFVESFNNEVHVIVTQQKNGHEEVNSPYFNYIQTIETEYIIRFDKKYKVYYAQGGNDKIIETGSNYYNT